MNGEMSFMNETSGPSRKSSKIISVGVIGAGVMGSAISEFLISRDIKVTLLSARKTIDSSQEYRQDLDSFDLIIECCLEELETKKSILLLISKLNPKGIIGTCTSSISVTRLQDSVENPARFCGIHFMNPPKTINIVELVEGELTSHETIEQVEDFLTGLDREVYKVADSPGFVVNSILISMLNQAVYTLDSSGLQPENLDRILKKTTGLRLGPLATIDLIGVDITVKIIQNLYFANKAEFLPPATRLLRMLENGQLGRKTQRGFFEYV